MNRFLALCLLSALGVLPLAAATAAGDLVGIWVMDADATWEKLKTNPTVAAVPAEQLPLVKQTFMAQMAAMTFEFTPDKLSVHTGTEVKTEAYVVLRTDGNALVTESTTTDGKKEQSKVEVDGAKMTLTNLGDGTTAILKRK
jgi:hypothetical protein